ncbi:DUF3772 domain-containing protein [Aliiruegeria sabulilitoris]|uniref:DUF3772 domain-containing protein n=1 Tax=Aliiruegeria sabulilitoris TaxID=1510458 RepID=UPI00082ADE8C|nr:DUF3772 domain-containing protein [Aliiruegeria sabulilitoris]
MRSRLALICAALLSFTLWMETGAAPGMSGWSVVAPASAQEAERPRISAEDYAEWEKIAARAEEALGSQQASDAAFESLRSDLVTWRSRFQVEESRDADRIATLRSQIQALGPVPEEGMSESEEIAARRQLLQEELNSVNAPVLTAEEAYTRANGLISRIDSLIRSRQKAKLLLRGPSPILPSHVLTAAEDIQKVSRILSAEVSTSAHLRSDVAEFRKNLPEIAVLLGLSLLLLIRGRLWFRRLVDWMMLHGGGEKVLVGAMLLSLGQVILPVLGVILFVAALRATGMFGPSGEGMLGAVPKMGMAFVMARWLGQQIFPRMEKWPTPLELTRHQRVRGRFYSSALGVLFAVAIFVQTMMSLFPLETETGVVFAFPVIVLAAICLAGLAKLLIAHGMQRQGTGAPEDVVDVDAEESGFFSRVMLLTGRACMVFAVAAPLAAMAGYTRAGIFLSLSPSLTLAILATVSFLQKLSMGLFDWLTGRQKASAEGLLPVVVNFALIVIALPFIALVWGVRKADLEEAWVHLQEGFTIGDTRVSLSVLFVFAIAFFGGMLATRLVQSAMRASVLPRTRIDPGGQKAVISGLGYLGIFLSAMIAVSVAGLDLSNLAIVAGALSVGVGFGLQNIVSNFVSGLILLIERPVTEGDWIEVGGVMGTVRKISVRATTVETFDRNNVIVPNSDFVSGQVTNWTRGNLSGRLILPVGVAYGTDTRKVSQILQEIAEAHPLVIVNPPPMIVFQGFGADSLDFEMRVVLRDINFGLGTRSEINHQIAERFAQEGIEIPFAQRDIWLRNPEALHRPPPAGTPMPMGPPRPDPDPEFPTEDDT